MNAPAMSAPVYVSPAVWAATIEASARSGLPVSPKTLQTARRISALSLAVKADLDALEAPLHVYRWVAWTPKSGGGALVRRRVELVQHLRRTLVRNGDGWFLEREHSAAFEAWSRARERYLSQGRIAPRAEAIPAEQYMEAITASARRTSERPSPSAAAEASPELRAMAKQLAEQLNRSRG